MYTQNVLLTAYMDTALLFCGEGASSEVLAALKNASAQFKSSIVWEFVVKSSVIQFMLCGFLLQSSERRLA